MARPPRLPAWTNQKLLSTTLFTKTVINSLVYTSFALVIKFFGGLLLGSMLNRPFIGQRFAKGLMLLPWILPTVFSTLIWTWILSPAFSIYNEILVNKLHLLTQPLPFLQDEKWAMASLIFINVWRGVPFFGITFLAAIQGVSTEILEASRIDGASAWRSFWSITFPSILPVVIVVSLISTIGTLGDFDLPFLTDAWRAQRRDHAVLADRLSVVCRTGRPRRGCHDDDVPIPDTASHWLAGAVRRRQLD